MIDSIGTTRRARRGMLREWRLHALSVFSLAVAFVCLGAALLVLTNLKALEDRWAHAGRVSVYLKDNAPAQDVESLKVVLAQLPNVTGVRYVSSGQARADFAVQEDASKGQLAGLPGFGHDVLEVAGGRRMLDVVDRLDPQRLEQHVRGLVEDPDERAEDRQV